MFDISLIQQSVADSLRKVTVKAGLSIVVAGLLATSTHAQQMGDRIVAPVLKEELVLFTQQNLEFEAQRRGVTIDELLVLIANEQGKTLKQLKQEVAYVLEEERIESAEVLRNKRGGITFRGLSDFRMQINDKINPVTYREYTYHRDNRDGFLLVDESETDSHFLLTLKYFNHDEYVYDESNGKVDELPDNNTILIFDPKTVSLSIKLRKNAFMDGFQDRKYRYLDRMKQDEHYYAVDDRSDVVIKAAVDGEQCNVMSGSEVRGLNTAFQPDGDTLRSMALGLEIRCFMEDRLDRQTITGFLEFDLPEKKELEDTAQLIVQASGQQYKGAPKLRIVVNNPAGRDVLTPKQGEPVPSTYGKDFSTFHYPVNLSTLQSKRTRLLLQFANDANGQSRAEDRNLIIEDAYLFLSSGKRVPLLKSAAALNTRNLKTTGCKYNKLIVKEVFARKEVDRVQLNCRGAAIFKTESFLNVAP